MTHSETTNSATAFGFSLVLLLLALFATITGAGCRETKPERLEISGVITLDQKAIGPVLITLIPTEPNQVGCTMLAESGAYQTSQQSGPSEGTYQVIVSSLEPELEELESRRAAKQPLFSSVKIPLKYQRPGELWVDIESGVENHLRLELSSK
ncbi:MAG: hypothetical protein JNL67_10930 [Planctomycetaceae bacterium]|nr:hypothetical protein [Planctomycetaceae bacterium]